jgi:hypothetical protein
MVGVMATNIHAITADRPTGAASAQDARAVVKIVAPIVLDVSEDGKSLGSTEQPTLSLPPGKHVLTLSNVEFGYTYTHTFDINAGDVRTITLDPRVAVDFRASPWAEVWMNDEKIGRTPFVHELRLGTHELVFKHPRFGERHITATVRATMAAPITVDMRKAK